MRFVHIGVIVFTALFIAIPVQAQVSFQSGFHVDWWSNDDGDSGRQVHIPIAIGGEFGHFSFELLTAQVYNHIDRDDSESRNIDGQADTSINLGYEIVDRWPVDLLVALDLNLPSGKTGLDDLDAYLISDSDLVTITRMGQGLNINPSITVLKQWDRLMAAVGLGYIWRGSYDASESRTDYNPGNALSLTAETVYFFNPHWTARLFCGWTSFTADQWDAAGEDQDYYKPGDVWSFGGAAGYTRARWHLSGRMTVVVRDKESRFDYTGDLATEDHNSYGNEWIAEVSGGYSLNDRTDLQAHIRYLSVAANDYDTTDGRYVSKRTKASIGCEVIHRWSAVFESGLRLSTFALTVEDNPDDWDEEEDFRGGSLAVWGAIRF